ncbi:MAG: CopG family antitoxin [Gammaproteobacteria bacterium]|jgi:hypothetical protein
MKKIPTFKTENKEADFWAKADSTNYIDWNKATLASFSNLKHSDKITLKHLPEKH